MAAREVVESFWEAMSANDWDAAAAHFADGFVVDWPCSGERFTSRENYAEVQRRYPSTGRWTFAIHSLVADDDRAVTELTASDGEQAARAIFISEVAGDRIARQVEYWPEAYEPAAWREGLTERIDAVP
jgi:limonene-1,2-epoxide hydrolase